MCGGVLFEDASNQNCRSVKGQAGRQAQRIESDEMPLTMVEQVRRGGAANSTDSSRGSKVFSSARISRRAR